MPWDVKNRLNNQKELDWKEMKVDFRKTYEKLNVCLQGSEIT